MRVSCVCFNLTKQNRPSGINFFLYTKSRLYVAGCWPPVLSPPSLPPPPPLWPQQCHSPYGGEGSRQELGCRCVFSKHNNLHQWSLSTFPCAAWTRPRLLLIYPPCTLKDHTPSSLRSGEKFTPSSQRWEMQQRRQQPRQPSTGKGGRGAGAERRVREGRRGGGEARTPRE